MRIFPSNKRGLKTRPHGEVVLYRVDIGNLLFINHRTFSGSVSFIIKVVIMFTAVDLPTIKPVILDIESVPDSPTDYLLYTNSIYFYRYTVRMYRSFYR